MIRGGVVDLAPVIDEPGAGGPATAVATTGGPRTADVATANTGLALTKA